MRANDLTGQKFGRLTAINRAESRQGVTQKKTRWHVQCDCGLTTVVDAGLLTRKDSKAKRDCGQHKYGPESPHWRGFGRISASYFGQVRAGAKIRNLYFDLTIEDLDSTLTDFCALSGLPISTSKKTASLDRIDSTLGYTKDNIQWVHKDINKIKTDLDQNYFIELCKKVADNNG